MKLTIGILALLSAISAVNADNWAVLVAGSRSWNNYRHQAGVCHAYQVLHDHGIPDDHIVVMMYDDLADNSENPTPGVIINQPDGPNVYEGIIKDYTGHDVTPDVFFKVLTGDEAGVAGIGSGKVIKSGPEDRVFVNMVDHGNVGFFSFPNDHMYADDLFKVIENMHNNNQYKEMVMYMESCESGSLYDGIYPDNMGFYVTTSADPTESSYACYFDSVRDTYIGDLFGCCWMENSDESDLTTLTLGEQYQIVYECNSDSHSPWYGQPSIQDEVVGAFLGMGKTRQRKSSGGSRSKADAVPSVDVPLFILKNKLNKANGDEKIALQAQINGLFKKREFVQEVTKSIATLVTGDEELAEYYIQNPMRKVNDWACYKRAVDAFNDKCFRFGENPFAMTMTPTLLNLCENSFGADNIVRRIGEVCTFGFVSGIE
ncbi:legumain-like [Macrobrachium rosenbergii]|uniref:legumain n=2 Tax=cellular organisms TaxID=131567 RepID=A0A342CJ46_MACRS|nr:legumain-like protein [Macrobrachium rosenbergii]